MNAKSILFAVPIILVFFLIAVILVAILKHIESDFFKQILSK